MIGSVPILQTPWRGVCPAFLKGDHNGRIY
nr:MAG TPA: hypothetical protein [Caudoviricetes sp.]